MSNELTVDRLNEIQAQWMALDSADPQPVKQRVFTAMKLFPSCHLSLSRDGKLANVFNSGAPMFAEGRPIDEAKHFAEVRGIQTRFAWQCDKWTEIAGGVNGSRAGYRD